MRYFRQMDRLVPKMLDALTPGKKTWIDQIIAATSVNAGDVEDATFGDCITHMISFPWKVLFAFVPPPMFLSGWLTFIVTLALIGVITAVVGDLASIFGCMVGLKDSITAITFVAMGTSLPDTFASRFAAMQDKTADNAIGNVTGSNSVNVFLGLGLPWFVAAVYWASKGEPFMVQAGSLGFSVTVYTIMSLFCLGLLFARRKMALFGQAELGGPQVPKILSAVFMVTLWILYVLLSSLQAYGYINV
uniref:Sodium/calcium exchanger membrane region domain-containing protein n=1 Tax=Plectus sambesii TaxID=2011161 RepID=A0A914XQN5_9BILA